MSKTRLKNEPIINLLYTQFKNTSIPNQERFQYAKLLMEKCFSSIPFYPESIANIYLGLSTITKNDRYKQYILGLFDHFDFDALILLETRIDLNEEGKEDNQLLRRLASIFYLFMNEELQSTKNLIDINLEKQLKTEINTISESFESLINVHEPKIYIEPSKPITSLENNSRLVQNDQIDRLKFEINSLLNAWDTFTDNEDKITSMELELSELESIYEFNLNPTIKSKMDAVSSKCDELRSLDFQTNQIKLDNLQLQLKLILEESESNIDMDKKQIYIRNGFNYSKYTDLNLFNLDNNENVDFEIENSEPQNLYLNKYPNLDVYRDSELFSDFQKLRENGNQLADLANKLILLRQRLVINSSVPEYVFKEPIIEKILFYLPETTEELLRIRGIGNYISTRIGDSILEYISETLIRNPDLKLHFKSKLLKTLESNTYNHSNGVKFNRTRTFWTKEQDESLKELFRSGLSIESIATSLNRSQSTVKQRLIKLGLIQL